MNILMPSNDDLVTADYSDLLEKIITVLTRQNPFVLRGTPRQLIIDIDEIASQVATLDIQHPLGDQESKAVSATINFTHDFRENFSGQISRITDILKRHLQTTINSDDIQKFTASLISSLDSEQFKGDGRKLGLKYDFGKPYKYLNKAKLTLKQDSPGSHSLFKFHKLTILIDNTNQFADELQQGIQNYIDEKVDDRDQREDLNMYLDDMIKDDTSDFYRLIKIVDQETLGKLKKEAKICYLEYLLENISNPDRIDPNTIYLEDLIRRLRLIEEYINDPNKSEGDYQISYAGVPINLKEIFSRGESLDSLPIIPIVDGYLGETTDSNNGESKFIFGLKMKFDNPVQSRGGDNVFKYNLNLLNPNSQEHQEKIANDNPYEVEIFSRKVLKLAFLYYFVFASNANPHAEGYTPESELYYNPQEIFDNNVLPILQGSDEDGKRQFLRGLLRGFSERNMQTKIDRLKRLIKGFLDHQTILPIRTIGCYLSVRKGILEDINQTLNTGRFFPSVVRENPKKVLQYIKVGTEAIDSEALCQLGITMDLEDIRYFPTEKEEKFTMQYNIKGVQILPILWVPKAELSQEIYEEHFKYPMIVFRYDHNRWDDQADNQNQANKLTLKGQFIYKFTIALLAYISLVEILLKKAPRILFLPMVRLHEGDHHTPKPPEKFMAHVSGVLCQLLSEKYRANTQGFRIKNPKEWNIINGLSSLYSILPKQFILTNSNISNDWEKLVIIIVSSQNSDVKKRSSDRQQRKANLLGEVVGIKRLSNDRIEIKMLRSFSENYGVRDLYNEAPILGDVVSQLYDVGCRHFIYVAQAPYSSNLHITTAEENERLFFMSKNLIRILKGEREDIKIYPIFFDKYYVRSPKKHSKESFYIDDIQELETTMFQDSGKKAVMFFNLLNGIKVDDKNDKNFYNGCIAYSTLLNIYQGILDDQDIREGLIYDGTMRNTLLNCLLCFHFSRYESRSNISLKLDPYGRIIGDESVGVESIFKHIGGSADFNCLAFLTEVKSILLTNKGS